MHIVRYETGEHYGIHHDALRTTEEDAPNRRSSFFVNLRAIGFHEGGGTHFPFIDVKSDRKNPLTTENLCQIIHCENGQLPDVGKGISVKPVEGSATFWLNIEEDGSFITNVVHAGERLASGIKYGMNIWTWNAPVE
jgi:prolyl 4-hydroxylase